MQNGQSCDEKLLMYRSRCTGPDMMLVLKWIFIAGGCTSCPSVMYLGMSQEITAQFSLPQAQEHLDKGKLLLKTNICDEWVCSMETSGTALTPKHSSPLCSRMGSGRIQRASGWIWKFELLPWTPVPVLCVCCTNPICIQRNRAWKQHLGISVL